MSLALIIACILAALVPGGAKPADIVLGGPPSITADSVLGGPPSK
jgi:hypothetical protein